MTTEHTVQSARIQGVDLCRFIAIVGVICIHVAALQDNKNTMQADEWIAALSRFAVPYFFAVSGFLSGRNSQKPVSQRLKGIASRILPVWIFWETAYVLYDSIIKFSHGITPLAGYTLAGVIIQGGPAFHLWFLPSLLLVSAIVLVLKSVTSWRYVLVLAAVCYSALLMVRYASIVPFDYENVTLDAAVRSLEGVTFFSFGYWVACTKKTIPVAVAWTMLVVGLICHILEVYFVNKTLLFPVKNIEITISLALLTAGLLFVSLIPLRKDIPSALIYLAQYTLGIYAVHLIFVRFIVKRVTIEDQAVQIVMQISVSVLLSYMSIYIMSRFSKLRPLIR